MSFTLNVVSDGRESMITILDKMVTQVAKSHARFIDLIEKEKTVVMLILRGNMYSLKLPYSY